MLVLGLNTAFSAMEAAIVRRGEILADARESMARGQDQHLPSFITNLLNDAGHSFEELDRISVVTGPGSFTGIRIGVAYARGLSLPLKADCVGVTSLEASVPHGLEGQVMCALQAQKRPPDQTWWVQGLTDGFGIADPVEVALPELSGMLKGMHIPVFMQGSEALTPELAESLDARPLVPSALTAALKARYIDPASAPPTPVYARAPDAALPPK